MPRLFWPLCTLIMLVAGLGPVASGQTPTRQIFINPNALRYQSMLMADALYESLGPRKVGGVGPEITYDGNRYPTYDFEVQWLTDGREYAWGTYKLSFKGQADVQMAGITGVAFTNIQYNSATNTTTADYVLPQGTAIGNAVLRLNNTRRNPTAALKSGVTDVHLMRPVGVGGTTAHNVGEIFNRTNLTMLKPFRGIRMLNLNLPNGSPEGPNGVTLSHVGEPNVPSESDLYKEAWSARRLPSHPWGCDNYNRGMAVEHMIALANSDPLNIKGDQAAYINIPHWESDEWIDNFFLACRWGTDGVLPHTGPPGSTTVNPRTGATNPQPAGGPKWAALRGGLFVEFSNEISFNSTFPQWHSINRLTRAEVAAGGSDLTWDGNKDEFTTRYRAIGRGLYNVATRGIAIYGQDALGVKLFPVLMGQSVSSSHFEPMMAYIVRKVGATNVNKLLTHAGGDWYRSLKTKSVEIIDLSVDQIVGAGLGAVNGPTQVIAFCKKYGVKYFGYEGGNCIEFGDRARTWVPVMSDPRYWRWTRKVIDDAFSVDPIVDVLAIFADTAGQWAILQSPGLLDEAAAGGYRASIAAAAAWAASPNGAVSTDPLPPLATYTGLTVTLPGQAIVPGQPITPVAAVLGTNGPFPQVEWAPAEGKAATNGTFTIPPAANAPREVKVSAYSVIRPDIGGAATFTIPADPNGPPLVKDPSFEPAVLPAYAVGDRLKAFAYNPPGTAWTYTGGGGVTNNGGAFSGDGQNEPTPYGRRRAFIQNAGTISQTVTGWAAGSYQVGLSGAPRRLPYNALTVAVRPIDVLIDGNVVGTWTANPNRGDEKRPFAPEDYLSPAFTVPAGDHTLTIRGLALSGTDVTALIDNVAIVKRTGPGTGDGTTPVTPPVVTPPVVTPPTDSAGTRRLLERLGILK